MTDTAAPAAKSGPRISGAFHRLLAFSGLIALVVAFSLASLLLLLVGRRRAVVRVGLIATLALIALLLALTEYLIWSDSVDSDVFPRVYGIVAILTALGAIVVPVLSLLVRDEPRSPALSADGAALLAEEAQRRGMTPDELLRRLLADAPAGPPAP